MNIFQSFYGADMLSSLIIKTKTNMSAASKTCKQIGCKSMQSHQNKKQLFNPLGNILRFAPFWQKHFYLLTVYSCESSL